MTPLRQNEVPAAGHRPLGLSRDGRGRPAPSRVADWRRLALRAARLLVAGFLFGAAGCSLFSLEDREFASELAAARAAIAGGSPASTIARLERLAWRRRDSIEVRRLLVEACRAVNSIESRRVGENALRELTVLEPDNPDVRFELAEILIRRGFDLDARRQLERVLERNPRHARAHLALGYQHEALYQRTKWPQDLGNLLGHFSRAADLDPDLYEARKKQVEALMLDGQWESALLILERLREKWPEEGWLHALAGTCLARPGTYAEAGEAFARSFERMSRSDLAAYQHLDVVADPYTFDRFDVLAPDEREDFLRVFWRSRDPLPVTAVNERQIEHWRRVVMADLLYGHRRLGIRGWNTARGEMYVRYGAPIHEEYVQGSSALLFSIPSWYHVYRVGGRTLGATFYDTALNGLFYHPFTSTLTSADVAAYTAPESYQHRFGGRWLQPAMHMAAFAGPSGLAGGPGGPSAGRGLSGGRGPSAGRGLNSGPPTRAEIYLAVPVDSLAAYAGSSLEVGTVVFDREWKEVARRAETLDLDSAMVAGEAGRVLVHEVNLTLEPGEYIVATQVEGEAGAVIGTLSREVAVDRFGGDSLELSVPELAFEVGTGPAPEPFRKGDLCVIPNATGQVQGGERLVVYFEIYNLTGSEGQGICRYVLRYRIAPADRKGGSVFARMAGAFRSHSFIESHFEEESPTPSVRRHLTIDVSALKPDRYALELEVMDLVSGTEAVRRLEFSRAASAR